MGKTTFSAATAYYLAKKGKRVLVFSVDPQASLTDIFQRDIFGKGPTEIMPNLYAQEIDADRRVKEYQQEIRQKILDMYGMDKIPDEIESYIQAAAAEPAMEESAIFDEVVDIVVKGGYDYYIYDLVPLGHALYYLSMASVYDAWIDKITGLREQMREYDQVAAVIRREKELDEDAILNELLYIKERINKSSSILTDKTKDSLLLRRHRGRDGHQGYREGGRTLRQVRCSLERVYHQPGSARDEESEHSRIPEKPADHAGPLSEGD